MRTDVTAPALSGACEGTDADARRRRRRGDHAGQGLDRPLASVGVRDEQPRDEHDDEPVSLRPADRLLREGAGAVLVGHGAQITAAARKYFVPEKTLFVVVGDKAKIGADIEKLNLGPIELWTPDATRASVQPSRWRRADVAAAVV